MLFFIKYEKIDYVYNYYKAIAFDVFKVRANLTNNDLYVISKDIIEELYNIFNEYDKLTKCDIKLYNPLFAMRMRFKKNKIFDKFYIRFSTIITLLNYNEIYKISILKRFIIIKLRLQTLNDIISSY